MTTTRILLIDDNEDIHKDFRKVLCFAEQRDGLDDLSADLFGEESTDRREFGPSIDLEIESAFQGEDGIALAEKAVAEGRPHAMAFVDVRMPPGLDGVQTIKRIWENQPDLQCVICTAYSDYNWDEITGELNANSNLLILKKPFDAIEVLQIVHALAEKYELSQERGRYQRELEDKIEELNCVREELTEKNRELVAARQSAESHSLAKSQFLANVSHELRTPLNGVTGMVHLLIQTDLGTQQRKFARTIKSSAELLLEMLNEILDFSKIEAGKLELEEVDFDLCALVESIVRVVAHKCQEKQINLSYYVDPRLRAGLSGDPTRIRQVLLNLVNNAVKFTEQGEVTIEILQEEPQGNAFRVRFEVTDGGIGIPDDARDRLFQAFTQVDSSTSRKYGGTGLGLAICKQLCHLMGGEIDVESEVGRGSKFWFTLPAKPAEKQRAYGNRVSEPFSDARILVVDACQTHGEILSRQLGDWGFTIDLAASGGRALEMLCTALADDRGYDIALIDDELSGMSGRELAIAVKANPRLRETTMIAMMPLGVRDPQRAQLQGFSDYVSKPIMQSELFDSLLRCLLVH